MKCGDSIDKYKIIVSVLCNYYSVTSEQLRELLKKKENKYLYLLLMKDFKCFYKDKLKNDLSVKSDKSINYNLKKAEEKLLINKEFRVDYFSIEEKINRKI